MTLGVALVTLVGALVVLTIANRYQLWRLPKPNSWPRLLMYHSIANEAATGMNTPPERFDAQLAWLKKQGYVFCTVSELLTTSKPKAIAITFDDGFANNYHQAFPLLKKYQAKATIYLAPEIAAIDKLMTAQISEMQASGLIEFGAHSMTHLNLLQAPTDIAQAEIVSSKQQVEALTGVACLTFAYPFGRFGAETIELVKAAGFSSAVTTKKKIIAHLTAQTFTIPRISTHGAMDNIQFYVAVTRGRYKF
ncbi:MAG: polysaccharide deacetylase family protein [Moraxellaceae bacterium]|nr:polysaccharide deacetylase family protein [Moraxellaceae bacterium]